MNLLDYEKYYHLGSEFIIPRDEFEKIIEENQKIKKYYEYDMDTSKEIIAELEKEKQRLNNVLNELEKELEQEYAVNKTNSIEEFNNSEWYIKWNCYKNILDKLKELKESDK